MPCQRDEFISVRRHMLLQNLFLPWRRRGASLLLIGLASGLQADFFWASGFEVSASERDPQRLDKARAESSPCVDFFTAPPDHQPFDDDSYDYAVLAHLGLKSREPLAEAVRVARRGVIVLEWNSFSLAARFRGDGAPPVSPWNVLWLVRQECPGCGTRMLSMLPLPPFTWPGAPSSPGLPTSEGTGSIGESTGPGSTENASRPVRRRLPACVHDLSLPLPLGALMGLRIDLEPLSLTPLGTVTEALRAASRPGPEVARAREGLCRKADQESALDK